MAQLVGQLCVHCRERVGNEIDAHFCAPCSSPVHATCAAAAISRRADGDCPACGGPIAGAAPRRETTEAHPLPEEPRREPPDGRPARPRPGVGTIICTALGGMLLAWEMPRMLGALLRFADDEPEYALERLLVVWVFCEVGVGLMVPLFRHHYATRLGPPERGDPDEDEGW